MMLRSILRRSLISLPFLVLLIGLGAFAATKIRLKATAIVSPHTIVQQQTTTIGEAAPSVNWTLVRGVRSDGNFVERRTAPGGELIYLAFSQGGKFLSWRKDSTTLTHVSDYTPGHVWSETGLESDPRRRKYEPIISVLGEQCHVLRLKEDAQGNFQDMYFSPKFNLPLGMVLRNNEVTQTTKTISISYGEPSPSLFENLPVHLPVKQGSHTR